MLKKIIYTTMVFFLTITFVYAQDNVSDSSDTQDTSSSEETTVDSDSESLKETQEVVVTASKMQTPLKSSTADVTVIDNVDLSNSGVYSSGDVLTTDSSLYIGRNGARGGVTSLFLGGAPSNATAVMIDGFRINNSAFGTQGEFNFAMMNAFGFGQIEVARGAQSTLYGTDSLAGAVNFITSDASTKDEVLFEAEAGSYETTNERFSISQSDDKYYFNMNFSHYYSGGMSKADVVNAEKDTDNQISFLGKAGYMISDNISMEFIVFYSDLEADIDTSFPSVSDADSKYRETLFFTGGKFEHVINEIFSQNVELSFTKTNKGETSGNYMGDRFFTDYRLNCYYKKLNVFTVGVDYSFDTYEDTASPIKEKNMYGFSVYAQDVFTYGKLLTLQSGARFHRNELYGNFYTFQAGGNINLKTNTILRTNAATGYRTPTFYELYAPMFMGFAVGNEDLKPEETFSFTGGIEQTLMKKIVLAIDYSYLKYYKMIKYGSGYEMADGDIDIHQVNYSGKYLFNKDDYFSVTFSQLIAEDENGNELARRPSYKGGAAFKKLCLKKVNVFASYTFVGERYDDAANTEAKKLESYHLVNAKVEYFINDNFSAFVRGENLLNQDYQEAYGYMTPGISVYGGAKAVF